MNLSDQDIEAIARKIAADLQGQPSPAPAPSSAPQAVQPGMGVFSTVAEAVDAARAQSHSAWRST